MKLVSFYLLFFFLWGLPLTPSKALEFREKIEAAINDISTSGNRLILERGTEDGIVVGDYARLYLDKHLIGSIAAIDTENNLSEWVFHRIYRDNILKTKEKVTLVSLYGKEKPPIANLEAYKNNSLLKEKRDREQKDFIEKQLALKKERKSAIEQIEKDYDDYHSLQFPPVSVELFVSPFISRSHNRGKNYSYGASVENMPGDSHYFHVDYQYSHQSFNSYLPNNSYSFSQYQLSGKYIKDQFWNKYLDHLSLLSFSREREQNIYPVKSQVRIGPIGLHIPLVRNKAKFKEISISYIPVKEYYSYQTIINTPDGKPIDKTSSTWRHHLELLISYEIYPKTVFTENFIYRPAHKLFTGTFSSNDSDLLNIIGINYEMFPSFSVGYQNKYTWDTRRRQSIGYPSAEDQNLIQLFYQFDKR